MAAGDTYTAPFCGSCGWDAYDDDLHADLICDACGADLTRFGLSVADQRVPTGITVQADLPIAGWVTVGYAENPDPGVVQTALQWQIDGGGWTEILNIGGPESFDATGASTEVIEVQLRTVGTSGTGPWSASFYDVVA